MRLTGLCLLFIGLIAVVVGTFSGCGTLFGWNGRHTTDSVVIETGHTTRKLVPEPGRCYTVSVQVVFDREQTTTRDGTAEVEARFPLVIRVTDPAGTVRAQTAGWLDPSAPPNVLYGQSVSERQASRTELRVERLVGPFIAASNAPLSVDVDLGADTEAEEKRVSVAERRLVIYDDALPPRIRNAFLLAAAGSVSAFAGLVLVVVGWWRGRTQTRRRGSRKRGGIRAADVV